MWQIAKAESLTKNTIVNSNPAAKSTEKRKSQPGIVRPKEALRTRIDGRAEHGNEEHGHKV